MTPDNPTWRDGFHHVGIDNGAWKAFKQNKAFDGYSFEKLVDRYGPMAEFVVIPDIVAGGYRSLEFSLSWMPKLRGLRRLLLPVLRYFPGRINRMETEKHVGMGNAGVRLQTLLPRRAR